MSKASEARQKRAGKLAMRAIENSVEAHLAFDELFIDHPNGRLTLTIVITRGEIAGAISQSQSFTTRQKVSDKSPAK